MKLLRNNISAFLLSGAILFLAAVLFIRVPGQVQGSVQFGSEYHSTTTSTGRFGTLVNLTGTTAQSGALGSVIITGAATGVINIYDATTTDVTLRTGAMGTSSILLATFPSSEATGTYTFDAQYYRGLIVETIGTMPTTTITSR